MCGMGSRGQTIDNKETLTEGSKVDSLSYTARNTQ